MKEAIELIQAKELRNEFWEAEMLDEIPTEMIEEWCWAYNIVVDWRISFMDYGYVLD